MKNITKVFVFILLIISQLSFSQLAKEESLLWKITGDEISEPSHLFGTIHIICRDDVKINSAEATAFSEAKKIYLELDLEYVLDL
jgi:hypothetical protein